MNLLKEIINDEKEYLLEIDSKSETDILTLDFNQNRYVNYHLIPPTLDWLYNMTFITESARKHIKDDNMIKDLFKIMLSLKPDLFTTLRHIIFTSNTDKDLKAISKRLDVEECEICDYEDYIGMFWYNESAIIINVNLIYDVSFDIANTNDESDNVAFEEFIIGMYSTLIHELRHLSFENPYIIQNETTYDEAEEDKVEEWCRDNTDTHLKELKEIAKKIL